MENVLLLCTVVLVRDGGQRRRDGRLFLILDLIGPTHTTNLCPKQSLSFTRPSLHRAFTRMNDSRLRWEGHCPVGRRKASSWTHRYEAQQGLSSDVGRSPGGRSARAVGAPREQTAARIGTQEPQERCLMGNKEEAVCVNEGILISARSKPRESRFD